VSETIVHLNDIVLFGRYIVAIEAPVAPASDLEGLLADYGTEDTAIIVRSNETRQRFPLDGNLGNSYVIIRFQDNNRN